jgi:ABC-2 type transport system ATP-binding protein
VRALDIRDLLVRYGDRAVVDRFSLSAEAGQITALIGPNGAGKTTTVEVCVGLRSRQAGEVRVLGVDPRQATPDDRSRVGVMLQDGGLYPTTRARTWLRTLGALSRNSMDADELIDDLGINAVTTVRRMSGGEVQRLKLASALIARPDLLFLDEPTTALDPSARDALLAYLRRLRDEGACIVLTTHDLGDVEDVADTVTVMDRGQAVMSGPVSELTGTDEGMRFRARPELDTRGLEAALPHGYAVRERAAGEYVITGPPTPTIMAIAASWCAEHGVLATQIHTGTQSLADVLRELPGGHA